MFYCGDRECLSTVGLVAVPCFRLQRSGGSKPLEWHGPLKRIAPSVRSTREPSGLSAAPRTASNTKTDDTLLHFWLVSAPNRELGPQEAESIQRVWLTTVAHRNSASSEPPLPTGIPSPPPHIRPKHSVILFCLNGYRKPLSGSGAPIGHGMLHFCAKEDVTPPPLGPA